MVGFDTTFNGDRWQFGKLENQAFTLNNTFYTIQELEKLFAAVNNVFQQCASQLTFLVTV